jgi:glycosyltransferase involved in cell wall biosynthesis
MEPQTNTTSPASTVKARTALPLTVSVITLNEERNLSRCLQSVAGLAAEIVVIDSGSTDGTAAVAAQCGAKFEFVPWRGHVGQKNIALERCSHPWVLCLDADEALSPELAASIRRLFAAGDPGVNGVWVNRRTFYLGDWIRHSWYPEWRLRLVRKGAARWAGINPHDRLDADGATGKLQGDLLHYPPFHDFHDHLTKTIKHARTAAESYAAAGRRAHWYNLVLSPAMTFFKHLILKQGWRDGWRGWLISSAKLVNVLAKYAILLEKQCASRKPEPPQ